EKHFALGTSPAAVTVDEDKALDSVRVNMARAVADIERLFERQDRKTEEALWKSAPEHLETAKAKLEWFDERVRARESAEEDKWEATVRSEIAKLNASGYAGDATDENN